MQYKESYEKNFADEGSRAEISQLLWELGWKEIVGGINGVPTVQQFNEVCGRIDRKANELRLNKLDMDGDASKLMIGDVSILDYVADIGARDVIFEMAKVRENIKSGETMSIILGKIQKMFNDLKPNSFSEADDPFVLMTESTYIPPARRWKGSLYGLVTKTRGMVVINFDRYVIGLEEPRQPRTLYGVERTERTDALPSDRVYTAILSNIVHIDAGSEPQRQTNMLYAITKMTKG